MSVFRWVGLVAVLGALVACADDTSEAGPPNENETTSQSSYLGDPGMGDDVPVPQMPAGPWNDPDWKAPPAPDREHDPLAPEAPCGVDYQKIYDPGRGRVIEVPIVICN